MGIKAAKLALTATLALLGALLAVSTTCAFEPQQPNMYELMGKKISINYATSSFSGEPQMTVRLYNKKFHFRGQQIRVTPTEIGDLVNVTLKQIPDLESLILTMIIPRINLYEDRTVFDPQGSVMFETQAIKTKSRTTIAGPDLVRGVVQTYKYIDLVGKASRVEFIQPGSSLIMGEVTLSPTCPGPQRPGQICEQPFAGATVQVIDEWQMVVAEALTDREGLFSVEVDPGDYLVHVETEARLPVCTDVPVTALADGKVFVSVDCNTGIR